MLKVLIPAAGKGKRSGLDYPKSLYRINGIPIIIQICRNLSKYDSEPIVVINPLAEQIFKKIFKEFDIPALFVFQSNPNGMGDAVLAADNLIKDEDDVLLTWSDIPLLHSETIDHLVNCHFTCKNQFSFVTKLVENCYTIVERGMNGKISKIIETRSANIQEPPKGEREIGLFLFKKKVVFEELRKGKGLKYENGKNEHGFLNIIEIISQNCKVEGYPIGKDQDILSFNTPEDLNGILKEINY